MEKGWNNAPYNAAICIARQEDGEWQCLIIESKAKISKRNPRPRELRRLPGGKPNKSEKKPRRTARRELKEETGFFLRRNAKIIELSSYELRDKHVQYYFGALLSDCGGNIRRKLVWEKSGTALYPPRWVPLKDAAVHLFGNHKKAAQEFLEYLQSLPEMASSQAA